MYYSIEFNRKPRSLEELQHFGKQQNLDSFYFQVLLIQVL